MSIEVHVSVFPVSAAEVRAAKDRSVFIPFASNEPDGSRCFVLDFADDGDHLWSETVDGSAGVRVPFHKVTAIPNSGVTGLLATVWHARESLLEQHPKFKMTQEIGIVYDPKDTDGVNHFGLFVKVR